jgi:hypothetical protein
VETLTRNLFLWHSCKNREPTHKISHTFISKEQALNLCPTLSISTCEFSTFSTPFAHRSAVTERYLRNLTVKLPSLSALVILRHSFSHSLDPNECDSQATFECKSRRPNRASLISLSTPVTTKQREKLHRDRVEHSPALPPWSSLATEEEMT